MLRTALAVALLIVGLACVGLRVIERVTGGFVGEAHVFGVHVLVVDLPLVAFGFLAVAIGCVLLVWRSRR